MRAASIPPTIALDPGSGASDGHGTGLIAVAGRQILAAATIRRGSSDRPKPRWDRQPIGRGRTRRIAWMEPVEDLIDRICDAVYAAGKLHPPDDRPWKIAVEYVKGPTGFKHGRQSPIDPTGPIETAMIVGAVMREFGARRVMPGKHGKHHLTANGGSGRAADYYPEALIGRRSVTLPGHDDGGPNAHILSAYDIALAAWELTS